MSKRRDPIADFDFLDPSAGPNYGSQDRLLEVDGITIDLNELADPFESGEHGEAQPRSSLTKSEFVDQVASRADLGKSEAGKAVDAVLDTIQETLSRGSDVTFSGFGKFHVAERGARQGVHPRTGEPIQIAASKVPRFTAGVGLKKSVTEEPTTRSTKRSRA